MDGIDTLTTKKSKATRNAAARITASDFQRPGSGAKTAVAAVELSFIGLLLPSQSTIQAILHAMAATPRRTVLLGIMAAVVGLLATTALAAPPDRARVILLG